MRSFKLNPSDFAFLYEECPKCFYMKVVHGITRPRTPMPKVFITIDSLMKEHYNGQPTSVISPDLPPGRIDGEDLWLRSKSIEIPGREATCYIVGRLDSTIAFDDGDYGVIDFKTSHTKDNHVELYGRQLHAYGYALEHPAPKAHGLYPVTTYGLQCVDPITMTNNGTGVAFGMNPVWIPIAKEEDQFLSFLDDVLTILELPFAPAAGDDCGYCKYRAKSA